MTDSTTAAAATPATKTKTVQDMDKRRIFTSAADAMAYLNLCAADFTDFGDIPLASVGLEPSEDGESMEFNPEIYSDAMSIMVSTLSRKGTKDQPGSVKAIVVAPIPTLDSLLSDQAGRDWVWNVLLTQLNHVAVRALREAEDVSTVVDQMPDSREAYITSSRDTGGGIMAAFDDLYKDIKITMSKKIPVWNKANPSLSKNELKKAFESRGYALEYYPQLEDRGEGKDSLFVLALNLAINAAKQKGFDPTIFDRWLSTRNAKTYTPGDESDEDDFDLDSLTASMVAEPKVEPKTEEPAPEAEATA